MKGSENFFVVSACFQVFLLVRLMLSTVFCCRDRLLQGHLVITSQETLIVLISSKFSQAPLSWPLYLKSSRCFRFSMKYFDAYVLQHHASKVHWLECRWPWLLQTRKRISACKFGCCRKKDISAVVANGTGVKNVAETIFYANAAFLISSGRGKIFRDVARTWKVNRRAQRRLLFGILEKRSQTDASKDFSLSCGIMRVS